jgi:hypothetical protein
MPLPRWHGSCRPAAQEPADGTAERSYGEHSGERVLLYGPAHGFSALPTDALGLRHVAPALLQVALAAPVEIKGEVGRLLGAAVASTLNTLTRRDGSLVQVVGLTLCSNRRRAGDDRE